MNTKLKQIGAFAALAALAIPAQAWDYRQQDQPYTYLYLRIPLDGHSSQERKAVWGLAARGKREYQVMDINSAVIDRFADMGFVESKLLIVGAVAVGGALAVTHAGSKSAATEQQQQQAAVQQQKTSPTSNSPTPGSNSPTPSSTSPTPSGPCVCPAPTTLTR